VNARSLAGLLVVLAAGCADTPALVSRGSDPREPRDERCIALHDALAERDPDTAPTLTTRAETLLAATGTPEELARNRQCALDILDALVRAGDRSASPLAARLSSQVSPLLASRDALEHLTLHPAASVRDLARDRLAHLAR
jgi:hypothetical protein